MSDASLTLFPSLLAAGTLGSQPRRERLQGLRVRRGRSRGQRVSGADDPVWNHHAIAPRNQKPVENQLLQIYVLTVFGIYPVFLSE